MFLSGNIKFFCILWGAFMALYFVFSTSEPIWNTAFYCATILLARNNINETRTESDVFWKQIGVAFLDILLVLFVLFYLEPSVNTKMFNNIIGSVFAFIIAGGIIYDEGCIKR